MPGLPHGRIRLVEPVRAWSGVKFDTVDGAFSPQGWQSGDYRCARRADPEAVDLIERAGSQSPVTSPFLAEHSAEATVTASEPVLLDLVAPHGDDAAGR